MNGKSVLEVFLIFNISDQFPLVPQFTAMLCFIIILKRKHS